MALAQGSAPQQRVSSSPLVLVPTSGVCAHVDDHLVGAITTQKSCLYESGAVLFRGFAVNTANDFERVVEALDYEAHEFSGGGWLIPSGPKVTKVDLPVEVPLDYHNEGCFLTNPPSKVLLYCEVEPPAGQGATPLLQGHVLYDELVKREPSFVQQVRDKKLVYSRSLTPETWTSMFGTEDKEQVEKRSMFLRVVTLFPDLNL